MNVEKKLAKALGKQEGTLVVTAGDRDVILNEISARIARFEKYDPETTMALRKLRADVRDVFNKGLQPGDELMEQLYFLDSDMKEMLNRMTGGYDLVVTPQDFKEIATIMSSHLANEVPILSNFTKFLGRLAADYLKSAKPSQSNFDWKSLVKSKIYGSKEKGYTLPDRVSEFLGLKAGEPLSDKMLSYFGFWKPNGNLDDLINGTDSPLTRRTGSKYFKVKMKIPFIDLKNMAFGKEKKLFEFELFEANKLPKSWTNVPWVNFDGKVVEQNFTQKFEERLVYRDKEGNVVNNILQVKQKTDASWWDQMVNKDGKINDIADLTKAQTAFAVNGGYAVVKSREFGGSPKWTIPSQAQRWEGVTTIM